MTFDAATYKPSRIVGKKINQNDDMRNSTAPDNGTTSDSLCPDPAAASEIDISEDVLYLPEADLLTTLLMDRTTGGNIIWATDTYERYGEGYEFNDEITPERITGDMNLVIQPRIAKDKATAGARTKDKAEVFTPSWICKKMNDCIDDAWFGIDDAENKDGNVEGITEHAFDTALGESVDFSFVADKDGHERTWEDYVLEDRLEITCGEAPYIVSRYDATTGEPIPVMERYGILDRKIRIISENVYDEDAWLSWVKKAYQHTYGYEWQGDSILLARENLLATALDHYHAKFGEDACMPHDVLSEIAVIISWNIWQMDGLKFVVPGSCGKHLIEAENLFGLNDGDVIEECEGCAKNKRDKHNGIYALVMDWDAGKPVRFVDLF